MTDHDRNFFDDCGCRVGYQARFDFDQIKIGANSGFGTYSSVPADVNFSIDSDDFGYRGLGFYAQLDELTINGILFKDVFIYQDLYAIEDEKEKYQIILASRIGIVSMTIDGRQWYMVDPSEITVDNTDIEIVDYQCKPD